MIAVAISRASPGLQKASLSRYLYSVLIISRLVVSRWSEKHRRDGAALLPHQAQYERREFLAFGSCE
jgi:hypothetical protein